MRMLKIINIAVVPGTSVTVNLSDAALINGAVQEFDFCLTEAQRVTFDTAAGTEQVFIQIGASGTPMPFLTRLGNIFYSDRLVPCRKYIIAYGNNGLPAAMAHFINFNTPKCTNAYNPAAVPVTQG